MSKTDRAPPATSGAPSVGNTLGLVLRQQDARLFLDISRRVISPGFRLLDLECEVLGGAAPETTARALDVRHFRNRGTQTNRVSMVCDVRTLQTFVRERLEGRALGQLSVLRAELALTASTSLPASSNATAPPLPAGVLTLEVRDPRGRWGVVGVSFGVGCERALNLKNVQVVTFGPAMVSNHEVLRDLVARLSPHLTRTGGFLFPMDVVSGVLRRLFVSAGWRAPSNRGLSLCALRLDLRTITLDFDRHRPPFVASSSAPLAASLRSELEGVRQQLRDAGRTRELLVKLERIEAWLAASPPLVAASARWRSELARGIDEDIRLSALQAWKKHEQVPANDRAASSLLIASLAKRGDPRHTLPVLSLPSHTTVEPQASARIRIARAKVLLTNPDDARDALSLVAPLEEPPLFERLHPVVRLEAAITIAQARISIHAAEGTGRPALALEALERALGEVPSPSLRCRALLELVRSLEHIEEAQLSLQFAQRALREAPDDVDIMDAIVRLTPTTSHDEGLLPLLQRRVHEHLGDAERPRALQRVIDVARSIGGSPALEVANTAATLLAHLADDANAYRAAAEIAEEIGAPEEALAALRMAHERGAASGVWTDSITYIDRLHRGGSQDEALEVFHRLRAEFELPRAVEVDILTTLFEDDAREPDGDLVEIAIGSAQGELLARALVARAKTQPRATERLADLRAAIDAAPRMPAALLALMGATDDSDRQGLRRLLEHLSIHGTDEQVQTTRQRLVHAANGVGDANEARQVLEAMLQSAPQDRQVLLLLTRHLDSQGHASDLLALTLPRLRPPAPTITDLELCCLAAQTLLKRGDPAESARVIGRWRDAGGALDEVDLALQRRAMSLEFEGTLAAGNVERAVAFAQHAMDVGVEEATRWVLRAASHASGATRITTLRKLVAVHPEDPRALNALEEALRQAGDNAGLVALLEHRATTGTVLDRLTALRSLVSMMPTSAGTQEDRRKLVERIYALDPTDPDSLTSLASMERDASRRRDLWERLAQVVAADDPRRALALCELATSAANSGETDRSRSLLDTLLSNHPAHERGLALGLEIAPMLQDPAWTRRCALGILAAGTSEFPRPSLNLTLARACVEIERFDEALVASGRAATTATAGSDFHAQASRLWAELATTHGTIAERRLALRERRRAIGSELQVDELMEELRIFESDAEHRAEAVTFVCRSLPNWRPPMAVAAVQWIASLPTQDSAENATRAEALSAATSTVHDETVRRAVTDTALSLARACELPETILQLQDDADLATWSDDSIDLRRWALSRSGKREQELRRLERGVLDPDTPLRPSSLQRLKACFDGDSEFVDALSRLTRDASQDRAAQLARHCLQHFGAVLDDVVFLDMLGALAGCSMTGPDDWSAFSARVAAQDSASFVVRAIGVAQHARRLDPRSGAPSPLSMTEQALTRFPDHAPLYQRLVEKSLGGQESSAASLDALVSQLDAFAQRSEFDAPTCGLLFQRTAAALPPASGSLLLLHKARRCAAGSPLRIILETALADRNAWPERLELLHTNRTDVGAAPWLALLEEAEPHADEHVLADLRWSTARALIEEQRDTEAIGLLKIIIDATPTMDAAALELGMAYARNGQASDAIAYLGEVARREPFPADLRVSRAKLAATCGALCEQINDSTGALSWYQLAREQTEHGHEEWVEAMDALFVLRARVEETRAAAKVAREVTDALPRESPLALRWIRRVIESGGHATHEMINRGLSLNPSDPLIVAAAMRQFGPEDSREALIRVLEAALEDWDGPAQEETPAEWRDALARLYAEHVGSEEALGKAERLLRESIRRAPTDQRPLHALADLLERHEQLGEALDLRARAAALEPADPRNAPTIVSRTVALATDSPSQAMRWITFGLDAQLRELEFLDACLVAATSLGDDELQRRVWEAQYETASLPALTRSRAALALGNDALERDRADAMRFLELAATLARGGAPQSQTHRAAAAAWLGALLDPRASPESPAIEARARAMQRAAMGDDLSAAAWRAEIDLLAGPLREPETALALALDAVVARPDEEQLVTRLVTLATEVRGEAMAVEQLKRAATSAAYHDREKGATLRTLAQVARSAGMPAEARWALDLLSQDQPMPASMINIHAWTLRQLGGVDEEIVRVLRACAEPSIPETFATILRLFDDSTERAAQTILEQLASAPSEARGGLLVAAVNSCIQTPGSAGSVLAPLVNELMTLDPSAPLDWEALAAVEDVPDAILSDIARAALTAPGPEAASAAADLCCRALQGTANRETLQILSDAASSLRTADSADLVLERLHAIVRELGPSTSRARELTLLAAASLPEVSLEALLHEVLNAHVADEASTEALLGAMSARGYAGAMLDFFANRDDVAAEDLAAAAELAARYKDLESQVRGHRAAAATFLASQRTDAARGQLEHALLADPDDWRTCEALVVLHDQAREWSAAFEQMAPVLAQFPEDPERLIRTGRYARKSNRLRACVDLWRKALPLLRDSPGEDAAPAWLQLAEQLHQVLEALELTAEATELALQISTRRQGEASIEWTIHAARTASPEDRQELLEDALRLRPTSLRVLELLEQAMSQLPSSALLHELWILRLSPAGLPPFGDAVAAAERAVLLLDDEMSDTDQARHLLEVIVGVPSVAQARHHARFAQLAHAQGDLPLAESHAYAAAQLTASLDGEEQRDLHLASSAHYASFPDRPEESIARWEDVRSVHPEATLPHRAILEWCLETADSAGIAEAGIALQALEEGPASPELLMSIGRAALAVELFTPACDLLEWAVQTGKGDLVDSCVRWIDAAVGLGDHEREAEARDTLARVSGAELSQPYVHAEFRNLAHSLLRPGAAAHRLLERVRVAGHSGSYLELLGSSIGSKFSTEALIWTIVSVLGEDDALLSTYLSFAIEASREHADPSSALAGLQHLVRSGQPTEHLADIHAWALRETGGVTAALADAADAINDSLTSAEVLKIFEHARRLFDDDERWCSWCMVQCERAEKSASVDALSWILDVAVTTNECQLVVNVASLIERKNVSDAPPLEQFLDIIDLYAAHPVDQVAEEMLEFTDRQFARGAPTSRGLDVFLCDYTRRNPHDVRAIHVLLGSRGRDDIACVEAMAMLCVQAELSPSAQGVAWSIGATVIRSSTFSEAATEAVIELGSSHGTRALAASLQAEQQLDSLLKLVRRSPWDLALTEPALEIAASHSAYHVELELLKIQLAISASLREATTQTSTLRRILHILSMRPERSMEEVEYSERLAFLASEHHDLDLAQDQLGRLIDGDLKTLASVPPLRTIALRRELARVYIARGDRFAAARVSLEATDIAVRGDMVEAKACVEELLPLLPHCPVDFGVLDLLQRASQLDFDPGLMASWMYKAAQLGHTRDERALLQRSLELAPDDEAAALALEELLRESGAVDALHDFLRWRLNRIGVPETEQETRLVRGYVERLRTSLATHDPNSTESVALLETLIAISPAHVDARIEQATLQLEAGNIDAAVEAFEVVLTQIPEDDPRGFQAAFTVGNALFKTEPERAARLLLRAHQLNPKAEELAAPLASLSAIPLEPSLRIQVVEVLLNHGVMRGDLEWLFLDLLAQTNQMEQLHVHAQTMLFDDLELPLQRNVLELLVTADAAIEASPKLRASHLCALGDVLEALGEDPGSVRAQVPALWTAYGAPAAEVLEEIEAWLNTTEDPLPYLKAHAMFSLPDEPERHERVLRRAFVLAEDDEARAGLAYGIAHAAMARNDPEATLQMLQRTPATAAGRPEFSDLRIWAVRRLDQVDDEAEALISEALEAADPPRVFEQLLRLQEDDATRVFELLLDMLPRAKRANQVQTCVWLLRLLPQVLDRQVGLLRGVLAAIRRFDLSEALLEGWPAVHAVLCAQEDAASLDGLLGAVQVSLADCQLPHKELRNLASAVLPRLTSPDPLVSLAWSSSDPLNGALDRAGEVAHFLDDIAGYTAIPQGIIFRAWERLTELVPRHVVAPLLQELLQRRTQLREPSTRAMAFLFEERGDWLSLVTLLEFESNHERRREVEKVNALEWLARVHGDVFDDPEAATHRLTRAIAIQPGAAHLRVSLFERKLEAGAFEDALAVAEDFSVSDEIRGGARDALLRRGADAAVVYGNIPRALSLLVQRDPLYVHEDGAAHIEALRAAATPAAVAAILEEIAGRQSGALRLRALEALAERLIHEVGDHSHAARVLCSLIDEQPARVALFERLERCYAKSQRWDLLASQLVRMADNQPVVIRRRLLERAAQIQRVRLRNPEEAESILQAAKSLPGEVGLPLRLELARCKYERRDFAGVVETCRSMVHQTADAILSEDLSLPGLTSTQKAVVQLVSDASSELHGIDHALLDVYESLDSLHALPDHAIRPLAQHFLRGRRYSRFVGLLQFTARSFFAQGEFASAVALLSEYAEALEVEPDAPPRHVARLHLQTYLALPSPTNPSRRRARALLSSQLSIRDARGLVEELIDSLDDTRAAAGWILLGDALTFSDPGEARSAYERARKIEPSSVDAQLGLVRLLSSMALFDAALEVALEVLDEARLSTEMLGEVIVTATDCLHRLGRGEEALILLERAFDEVPGHWRLGCLLAESLARAELYGREHARLRALSRRELPPHQLARVCLRIARLLFSHAEQIELAERPSNVEIERHLQRALSLDPELTEAREILVELRRSTGDIKSMAVIWQDGLRTMSPGSSRASRLLDLCEVHISEIPSEALRQDYLLRAISERGVPPRILDRAESIVRRMPDTAQVASGLIIAAASLPAHDRLTQSRVLGLASVAWEACDDFHAAKLAKQAAEEALASFPIPSAKRATSSTGSFQVVDDGDVESASPRDADASASWPVDAWVALLTQKGLANVEERARSLDVLEMRELRNGKFQVFVDAVDAAATSASSTEGLAELRYDALDRLCRYGASKRFIAPLLRSSLSACPGDHEQTSRVLRLLANHTSLVAEELVALLPTPMRREELLIVLCAELTRSELLAPLRHAEQIERIERLTQALEPAAWIKDRLEAALSMCVQNHQREVILRGIRGCLRAHDGAGAREEATIRLVRVLIDAGDRERAIEECRAALPDVGSGSELERIYLDMAGTEPEVLEILMAPLHESERPQHPNLAALLLRTSRSLRDRHTQQQRALAMIQRAHTLQPGAPEVSALLIECAFESGEHSLAAEVARDVARTRGDVDDRLVLGAISEALVMGPSSEVVLVLRARPPTATRVALLCRAMSRAADQLCVKGPLARLDAIITVASAVADQHDRSLLALFSQWTSLQRCRAAGDYLLSGRLAERARDIDTAFWSYQVASRQSPGGRAQGLSDHLRPKLLPLDAIVQGEGETAMWCGPLARFLQRARIATFGITRFHQHCKDLHDEGGRRAASAVRRILTQFHASAAMDIDVSAVSEDLGPGMLALHNTSQPRLLVHPDFHEQPQREQRFRVARAMCAVGLGLAPIIDLDPIHPVVLLDALASCVQPARARRHADSEAVFHRLLDNGISSIEVDATNRRRVIAEIEAWHDCDDDGLLLSSTLEDSLDLAAVRVSGCLDGAFMAFERDRAEVVRADGFQGDALDERVIRLMDGLGMPPL